MNYKVVSISSNVAERVRQTMTSPYGNLPAWSSIADGYGPCRSCLKTFKQGEEERIYITYDPFNNVSDLPLPGPVFIHAESCSEYSNDRFPNELLSIPMLLEAYGKQSRLVLSEPVESERIEEQIAGILRTTGVESIHIRNAEAGCFIARIEPAT